MGKSRLILKDPVIITQIIKYKNSVFNVDCFGGGTQIVICFHGYGESASSFHFLEHIAVDNYRFYAVDLPYHGQTQWNEGNDFTTSELVNIISMIQNLHQLTYPDWGEKKDEQIILMGFSLGGRVCLNAYEQSPENFKKIILLAPDGLKVNIWYWLATQTWIGNRLFEFTMKKPGWFFKLLKTMNRTRWINQSIYKFVHFYINDEKVRHQLYQRWTGLRKIKPNLPKIKEMIREHKTPVRLIYGRYDRIILPVRGEKFCKGLEPFCNLKVIRSGHQVLHEKHTEEILQALIH